MVSRLLALRGVGIAGLVSFGLPCLGVRRYLAGLCSAGASFLYDK